MRADAMAERAAKSVPAVSERIRVVVDGVTLANSDRALCVLETSGPPVYYLPSEDVRVDLLEPSPHTTVRVDP